MPIKYKVDVLAELKRAGYSSYRIRKENIMGQSTLQLYRDNKPINWDNLSLLCKLLKCQPGDILEFVDEQEAREVGGVP